MKKAAGDVVAAGSGEVILSEFRKKDYGNWIVIDHGSNVYTSYAHLASVDPSISKGAQITQGQTLGACGHGSIHTAHYWVWCTLRVQLAIPGICQQRLFGDFMNRYLCVSVKRNWHAFRSRFLL